MSTHAMPETLEFPFAEPPKTGELVEVRPGIFWTRLALAFRLDHVNLYLVEDARLGSQVNVSFCEIGIDGVA